MRLINLFLCRPVEVQPPPLVDLTDARFAATTPNGTPVGAAASTPFKPGSPTFAGVLMHGVFAKPPAKWSDASAVAEVLASPKLAAIHCAAIFGGGVEPVDSSNAVAPKPNLPPLRLPGAGALCCC